MLIFLANYYFIRDQGEKFIDFNTCLFCEIIPEMTVSNFGLLGSPINENRRIASYLVSVDKTCFSKYISPAHNYEVDVLLWDKICVCISLAAMSKLDIDNQYALLSDIIRSKPSIISW